MQHMKKFNYYLNLLYALAFVVEWPMIVFSKMGKTRDDQMKLKKLQF